MDEVKVISINGVEYVRKDSLNAGTVTDSGLVVREVDGEEQVYVIVRADRAGVHAGWISLHDYRTLEGGAITIYNARMIWDWKGAHTLQEIAANGLGGDLNSKITPARDIRVLDACSLIPCSVQGKEAIDNVEDWIYEG